MSGFLDFLNPGDVVMADRGFLIKELLNERHVKLIIPPFWDQDIDLIHKRKP